MKNLLIQVADTIADRVIRRLAPLVAYKGKVHNGILPVRRLDMKCRVPRCKQLSRGPRFGYICDSHQEKLTKHQQQKARETYRAAHST